MSDTPRTDIAQHNMGSIVEPHYVVDADFSRYLERELVEAREQLHLCNVDQFTTAAELAEAQEELNEKRKFCYDVEKALEGMKGDYVEIIKELRKDAERYRWLRDDKKGRAIATAALWAKHPYTDDERAKGVDATIDAAIKELK